MTQHVQPVSPNSDSANLRGEALAAAFEAWARSQPEHVAALLAQWVNGHEASPGKPS